MNMPKHLLPTTVVGSYPQPEWLVDRAMLSKSVPRTRMHAMWRLPEEHLEEAERGVGAPHQALQDPRHPHRGDVEHDADGRDPEMPVHELEAIKPLAVP